MGYRRSRSDEPGSSRWRIKHRHFLVSCGLPDEVVDSDRRLTYVLLHGEDHLGTGWTPHWISPEQARALLEFLEAELPSETGYCLVADLRRYLVA